MVNMTLSIPDELHRKMKKFSEMKWSEVARRAIEQRVDDLEVMDKITSKSKLTKKDAEELGEKIKRSAALRFNEYSN
jgi:predicted CopG family antitoxin